MIYCCTVNVLSGVICRDVSYDIKIQLHMVTKCMLKEI